VREPPLVPEIGSIGFSTQIDSAYTFETTGVIQTLFYVSDAVAVVNGMIKVNEELIYQFVVTPNVSNKIFDEDVIFSYPIIVTVGVRQFDPGIPGNYGFNISFSVTASSEFGESKRDGWDYVSSSADPFSWNPENVIVGVPVTFQSEIIEIDDEWQYECFWQIESAIESGFEYEFGDCEPVFTAQVPGTHYVSLEIINPSYELWSQLNHEGEFETTFYVQAVSFPTETT
jgi:hypothetical protein